MSPFEIAIAQAYLAKSAQDPVAALIRSVRDLARLRRMLAAHEQPSLEATGCAAAGPVRAVVPALAAA